MLTYLFLVGSLIVLWPPKNGLADLNQVFYTPEAFCQPSWLHCGETVEYANLIPQADAILGSL